MHTLYRGREGTRGVHHNTLTLTPHTRTYRRTTTQTGRYAMPTAAASTKRSPASSSATRSSSSTQEGNNRRAVSTGVGHAHTRGKQTGGKVTTHNTPPARHYAGGLTPVGHGLAVLRMPPGGGSEGRMDGEDGRGERTRATPLHGTEAQAATTSATPRLLTVTESLSFAPARAPRSACRPPGAACATLRSADACLVWGARRQGASRGGYVAAAALNPLKTHVTVVALGA